MIQLKPYVSFLNTIHPLHSLTRGNLNLEIVGFLPIYDFIDLSHLYVSTNHKHCFLVIPLNIWYTLSVSFCKLYFSLYTASSNYPCCYMSFYFMFFTACTLFNCISEVILYIVMLMDIWMYSFPSARNYVEIYFT